MEELKYKVGELKHLIKESADKFEPKLGPNVRNANVQNNGKFYKDAEKRAKDYDGGLKEEKKEELPEKTDGNRTTIDYNPTIEPTDRYKKRVEAQAKGYNNEFEEESDTERNAEFDKDGRILKQFKDHNEKINKARSEIAHAGLVGKNLPKFDIEGNRLYEGDKKPKTKRLIFKNTRFMNEASMLSRIPEEYKIDEQVIYMKDGHDNEYIVECSRSEKTGNIELNVINYNNKKVMNEQVDKMMKLMGTDNIQNNTSMSCQQRINEDKEFNNLMNLVRTK